MDPFKSQFELSSLPNDPSLMTSKSLAGPLSTFLVADDLTGACDASVCFVHQGFTATVLLNGSPSGAASTSELVAMVSDTRNLEPSAAQERILALLQTRNLSGINIFHKVDSAGRGNPGAEMAALLGLTGCHAVVYAPAFPAAGRVVRKGMLHVTDFSGLNHTVPLASLIPAAHGDQIALISAAPASLLRHALEAAHSANRNFWICDAATEEELDALVQTASSLKLRLLWSGSAGLAAALARHLAPSEGAARVLKPNRKGRTLLLSGTDHPVTQAQLTRLPVSAVELNMDAEEQPRFSCGWAQINWTTTTPEAIRRFWERLHKADPTPIAALLLTGGDTAAFVLEALGAVSLRIGGELEQGIPWSSIEGGLAEGVSVLTKSGGFGHPESLARCVEFSQRIVR